MRDKDYTFGETFVYCDEKNCKSEENIEGFDGHPLPYEEVSKELKDLGWTTKNGNDYCSKCSEI